MSGKPGSNVDKFCRDAAKMHQLDKSVKETNVMRSVAGWHEKQGVALFSGTQERGRRQEAIKGELQSQGLELVRRRQERMRELLQAEREDYENELRQLGLTTSLGDMTFKCH